MLKLISILIMMNGTHPAIVFGEHGNEAIIQNDTFYTLDWKPIGYLKAGIVYDHTHTELGKIKANTITVSETGTRVKYKAGKLYDKHNRTILHIADSKVVDIQGNQILSYIHIRDKDRLLPTLYTIFFNRTPYLQQLNSIYQTRYPYKTI
jgi:hypothetical protein